MWRKTCLGGSLHCDAQIWSKSYSPEPTVAKEPRVPTQLFVSIFNTDSKLFLVIFTAFSFSSEYLCTGLTHSNRPKAKRTALKSLPAIGRTQENWTLSNRYISTFFPRCLHRRNVILDPRPKFCCLCLKRALSAARKKFPQRINISAATSSLPR